MSNLIPLSAVGSAEQEETSRRDVLRNIAIAALLGPLSEEAAAQVHQHAAEEVRKNPAAAYKPKHLTPDEFEALGILSDLIIPGARKAGAVEFIDLLCHGNEEFATGYTGGLAWMNSWLRGHHQADFLRATDAQRKELLDRVAYRKNSTPETAAGVEFFDLARRMCSDAYFTSREGVKAIGFQGNSSSATFEVPKEAIDYVLGRSPV